MNQSTTQREPLELLILMALKQPCKTTIFTLVISKLLSNRYSGIEILQVLDGEGEIKAYVYRVNSSDYPHFFGPG